MSRLKAAPGALVPGERTSRKLPVAYSADGVLLADVKIGTPVYLAGIDSGGELVQGIFASGPVTSVALDGFATAQAVYRVEMLAWEPGEFGALVDIPRQDMQPYEIVEMATLKKVP